MTQHCPPGRFLLLVGGGTLLYLSAFSPLRLWLQRMAGLAPPAAGPGGHNGPPHAAAGLNAAAAAPGAAAAAAAGGNPNGGGGGGAADGGHIAPADGGDAAGGGVAAAGGNAAPRRGGVLRELQALLIGFFTSLLPGDSMMSTLVPELAHRQAHLWTAWPLDSLLCNVTIYEKHATFPFSLIDSVLLTISPDFATFLQAGT